MDYNPLRMYDSEYTRKFYNAYGDAEWERLERSAYGRLQAIIHNDFLERYVKSGDSVLDAGSGPGRFSISLAGLGSKVTVFDISDTQLDLARKNVAAAGISENIECFVRGDISDLSTFDDETFDFVVCFGGALSYVCQRRQVAARELLRVTKPGGIVLASVMSRLGAILGLIDIPQIDMLNQPDEDIIGPSIWSVLESGDLAGVPSRRTPGIKHAPMHLYTAEELTELFANCEVIEISGSNVMMHERSPQAEMIAADPAAWETLVELERRLNQSPGLVKCGSHIILAARKNRVYT